MMVQKRVQENRPDEDTNSNARRTNHNGANAIVTGKRGEGRPWADVRTSTGRQEGIERVEKPQRVESTKKKGQRRKYTKERIRETV